MLVKFTPVLKRKILNDLTKVITHISCKRHYFCSCLTFPLLKGICALCEPFPFRRLCLWKMCFILLCRPESLIKISCSKHLQGYKADLKELFSRQKSDERRNLSLVIDISTDSTCRVSAQSSFSPEHSLLSPARCRKMYSFFFFLPMRHLWQKITWSSYVMPLCTRLL